MKKFTVFILILVTTFFNLGCGNYESSKNDVYEITVALNEDMSAECRLKLNYYNDIDGLEYLLFNLYPNAFNDVKTTPIYPEYFATAYPNGFNGGCIEIKRVFIGEKECEFTYQNQEKSHLKIPFSTHLNKGEERVITMDFSIQLPNVKHRFGFGENTINLTGFYPVLCVYENGKYYENKYYRLGDPFYSNVADYKINLTVPSRYAVASSMTPTSTNFSGENTTYHYERNSVRDIAFVLSSKFNVTAKTINGVKVFYYYINDKTPENSLDTAVKNIKYFSNEFLKYPYPEYVVCEADFLYGGMEYPCLTMIDCTLKGFDRDYCITHETAHQWWYALVGNNECEDSYIDEGLTELSTLLFFANHSEYGKTKQELLNQVQAQYIDIRKALSKKGITSEKMLKNLGEFTSDIEYVSISYYRSQIAFNNLYEFMGEKKFNKFLKEIIKEYKFKNIDTKNLLKIANKVKRGGGDVLENYINGTAVIG